MNDSSLFLNETIKLIISDLNKKFKNLTWHKLRKYAFRKKFENNANNSTNSQLVAAGKYDLEIIAKLAICIGSLVYNFFFLLN